MSGSQEVFQSISVAEMAQVHDDMDLLCSYSIAGYSAGEISPSSAELTKEWGISQVVYNLGITLFCIGFALAPMVLAPFSEINGRRPIFIASGILFVGMVRLMNDRQSFPNANLRSKPASLPVGALTLLEECLLHDSSRA